MLPLFKYFVNTVVLAPLLVKHLLKQEADWSQVLNVLGLATVLNVAAGARIGKPCLKRYAEGIAGLLFGVVFYYVFSVIFGAYLCQNYQFTLFFALWMSSMTTLPLALIYGLDLNVWNDLVIRRLDGGSQENSRLICGIYSLLVGAWAGSIVIPLDWDRPWQNWPIPNVIGAMFLALTTSLGFFLKDGPLALKLGGIKTGKKVAAKAEKTSKIPVVKRTPKKSAAPPSPVKAKASPAPKTPTRKVPAPATRARSQSPSKSKSPIKKRDTSPIKQVPSTPKASARSRSKLETPSSVRTSSRVSRRVRD